VLRVRARGGHAERARGARIKRRNIAKGCALSQRIDGWLSSVLLSAKRLAMAPAHYLAIDFDSRVELDIVFIEPLNFKRHRAHQLNQPLVFVERTQYVLKF